MLRWVFILGLIGFAHAQFFHWITPKQMDKGTVRAGQVIMDTIKVVYTGKTPLHVSRVHTSCGCTVAQLPKDYYSPGDTITIPFRIRTKGFKGPIRKTISIFYENPNAGRVDVQVLAKVQQEIEMQPSYLKFYYSKAPELAYRSFTITNNGKTALKLKFEKSSFPGIEVTPQNATIAPGQSQKFRVHITKPVKNEFVAFLYFRTNRPNHSQLNYPVYIKPRKCAKKQQSQ